ncbi:hypothetical protein QYM36_019240, partial [Artemia franciscana]
MGISESIMIEKYAALMSDEPFSTYIEKYVDATNFASLKESLCSAFLDKITTAEELQHIMTIKVEPNEPIVKFLMRISGEFEGYASLVKQIAGTENLFLGIDILKQQAFEQGVHDGIRRFIRERGACPETSSQGITPIHTVAVEITIQTSMLGRITVPQIEGISGEDILEYFRLQFSITGETEGIATEGTLDKIFKKVDISSGCDDEEDEEISEYGTIESDRLFWEERDEDQEYPDDVRNIVFASSDDEYCIVFASSDDEREDEDETRSTLEFWTSHRYHMPKEYLDHGGIQMVAIIDRQQFHTARKVVYVDNTRSTLEFWTSHRYHVPKECLDHGGIQMVAIINRQQFDTERKVVYVDN